MTAMLEAALQLAGRGWPVFQLSGTKKPLAGSHSFKDAVTDPAEIERMWGQAPWCNIGLACGLVVVFDADGPGGLAKWEALQQAYGRVETAEVHTKRGKHFYFLCPPGVRIGLYTDKRKKKGDDGLDIKGKGGYVVAPPSVDSKTGFAYRWANHLPVIEMPAWLVAVALQLMGKRLEASEPRPAESSLRVDVPAYVRVSPAGSRVVDRAASASRAAELPKLLAALAIIPADIGYDPWFETGAGIHDFDPGPRGLQMFKDWAWKAPGYRTEEAQLACERKWLEYGKPKPGKVLITIGSIYKRARDIEASIPSQEKQESKHLNGHVAPVQVLQTLQRPTKRFLDFNDAGQPLGSTTNAGIAIENLGVTCRKDTFHEKMLVGGHPIDAWAGDLSDDCVHMLRKVIKAHYGFDPGEKNTRDAAIQLCLENQFNPVVDYLGGLTWDGVERIGRWTVDYLGSDDTELNREFGCLMLIAAVRRARKPGCKFDQIIVLEGREGTGKSTALRILAGDDNFSDQNILAATDKEQQEAFTGVWIHEIAELEGMRRTDVARIKQFGSRTEDRARPAYGRIRIDMKRRGIFAATTNEQNYLKSETGNRRFWPIVTGRIDLEALARDRDQLWAEAAEYEAAGESIVLAERFRTGASEEQATRLEGDEWTEMVAHEVRGKTDTSVTDILTGGRFLMKTGDIGQVQQNRVARILKAMGFERYQVRLGKTRAWRYKSGDAGDSGATVSA